MVEPKFVLLQSMYSIRAFYTSRRGRGLCATMILHHITSPGPLWVAQREQVPLFLHVMRGVAVQDAEQHQCWPMLLLRSVKRNVRVTFVVTRHQKSFTIVKI